MIESAEGAITTFIDLVRSHRVWHVDAFTKKVQEWEFLSGGEPRGPHAAFTYRPVGWSYTESAFYSDVGLWSNVLPHRKEDRLFRSKEAAKAYLAELRLKTRVLTSS